MQGLYRAGGGPAFWRVRILDAGDVEEGGGEELADCYAKNDDHGMEESVDDLAFVGHGRRVKW